MKAPSSDVERSAPSPAEVQKLIGDLRRQSREFYDKADQYKSKSAVFIREFEKYLLIINAGGIGFAVSLLSVQEISTYWLRLGGSLFWFGFVASIAFWALNAGGSLWASMAFNHSASLADTAAIKLERGDDARAAGVAKTMSRPLSLARNSRRLSAIIAFLAGLLSVGGAASLLMAGFSVN